MSFARDVKTELARIESGRDCCRKAELYSMSLMLASLTPVENGGFDLVYSCDSPNTARKIYLLIKTLYGLKASVRAREQKRFNKTRIYQVSCQALPGGYPLLADMGLDESSGKSGFQSGLLHRNCCRRAFLRGVFLSRGYINRPEGLYHLELILSNPRWIGPVQKNLSRFDLEMRCVERKNASVLYLKEGERIGDFLRLIGASKAVLDFENARIVKYIRNTVNRQVNCETANVSKTIEAAVRQNQLIERMAARVKIDKLPADLQELVLLRLEFPDDNLRELGQRMDPPLSKSGTAYRMKKLESYASRVLDE